jgi:hypothetical protein
MQIEATTKLKQSKWYGSSYYSALRVIENGKARLLVDKSAALIDRNAALKYANIWRNNCLKHGKLFNQVY